MTTKNVKKQLSINKQLADQQIKSMSSRGLTHQFKPAYHNIMHKSKPKISKNLSIEDKECTFKPTINKNSKKLAKGYSSNRRARGSVDDKD